MEHRSTSMLQSTSTSSLTPTFSFKRLRIWRPTASFRPPHDLSDTLHLWYSLHSCMDCNDSSIACLRNEATYAPVHCGNISGGSMTFRNYNKRNKKPNYIGTWIYSSGYSNEGWEKINKRIYFGVIPCSNIRTPCGSRKIPCRQITNYIISKMRYNL